MKADDGKIVPAFCEVKYSYPESKKESSFTYEKIGEKIINLFETLHEGNGKKWIAKTIKCGVSWEKIVILYVSSWTFPAGATEHIEVIEDGRAVRIKSESEKLKKRCEKAAKPSEDEQMDDCLMESDSESSCPKSQSSEEKSPSPPQSSQIIEDDEKENPSPLQSSSFEEDEEKEKKKKKDDDDESIKFAPFTTDDGTVVNPKIGIVMCGGGWKGIRGFVGRYFGNLPCFTDIKKKDYERRQQQKGKGKGKGKKHQSSEPEKKKQRFSEKIEKIEKIGKTDKEYYDDSDYEEDDYDYDYDGSDNDNDDV